MAMIRIIFGKEPWFFSEEKRNLIDSIEEPEINVAMTNSFTEEVAYLASTYPIIGALRGIIVEVDNLSLLDNPWFIEYLDSPAEFTKVLVIARKVDQKTKFFKKVAPYCKEYKKLSEGELKDFIRKKVFPLSLEGAALSSFLLREDYLEGDIDLIGLSHDLEGLKDLARSKGEKNISFKMVEEVVKDRRTKNIFLLTKLLLQQNYKELSRQCSLISADAALPTIALLLYEFRIAYKLNYGTAQEIGVRFCTLQRVKKDILLSGIQICTTAMEEIKTGNLDTRVALLLTCEKLIEELRQQ